VWKLPLNVENVKKLAVVGGGIMAHGIAHVCAQAGFQVILTTRKPETLRLAFDKIDSELAVSVRNHVITKKHARDTKARITGTLVREEAVRDADFVIEAVREDLDLKRQIFKELDEKYPRHTILATNTSSFSITEVASATRRADKVVGTHWWNPPYLMPLVEIVKGSDTSDDTVDLVSSFIRRLKKVPVICKDSPGFRGVRPQAALFIEAMSILEQGLASTEDIDTKVKMTLGMRLPVIGPMETMDMGGTRHFSLCL
jgi:3-hydroxyacyl-CoA dehydrogenase